MSAQLFMKSFARCLLVCSAALALWVQASKAPELPAKEPPAREPPAGKWQVIATSAGRWSDGKACSVYADGQFDLSKAQWIRVTFERSQAGTKFFLRLLPKGKNPNQPVGVRWEVVSIPSDGIVRLPLKSADFLLRPADMSQLVQISIHSGDNAWGRSLGQAPGKCASFKKIEIQ